MVMIMSDYDVFFILSNRYKAKLEANYTTLSSLDIGPILNLDVLMHLNNDKDKSYHIKYRDW